METFKARIRNAWRSLTIWFNGVLLAAIPTVELLKDAIPDLQSYLDAATYKNIMLAIVTANIFLRLRTSAPLESSVSR